MTAIHADATASEPRCPSPRSARKGGAKRLRGFGLVGEAPGWVACGQACAGALEQRRRRRRRREGVEELLAVDLVAASAFLGGDGGGARDAFEQTDLAEVRLGAHGAQALLGARLAVRGDAHAAF